MPACHRAYRDSVDRWYESASTPSHAQPASEEERVALDRLASLGPDAQTITLPNATVSLEPVYVSAAHLRCRGLVVQAEPADGPATRRVACLDGQAWFLVPDLLEDGSSDGPEDVP